MALHLIQISGLVLAAQLSANEDVTPPPIDRDLPTLDLQCAERPKGASQSKSKDENEKLVRHKELSYLAIVDTPQFNLSFDGNKTAKTSVKDGKEVTWALAFSAQAMRSSFLPGVHSVLHFNQPQPANPDLKLLTVYFKGEDFSKEGILRVEHQTNSTDAFGGKAYNKATYNCASQADIDTYFHERPKRICEKKDGSSIYACNGS